MNKQLKTANPSSSWKQEVNRRIAAHMSRKSLSAVETEPVSESRTHLDGRAALAAERVAARYANAPSFGETVHSELNPLTPAAVIAAPAALEVEAGIAHDLDTPTAALSSQALLAPPSQNREASLTPAEPQPTAPPAARNGSAAGVKPGRTRRNGRGRRAAILNIQETDPAQPIPANLVQFPRPVIATRKKRPRRAEGPLAVAEPGTQLSIFEVEPETISTEPSSPAADGAAAQAWLQPDWPGIELDAPVREELLEEPPLVPRVVSIELAPLSRRLMAAVVDAALIFAGFFGGSLLAASKIAELPGPRSVELTAGCALLLLAVSYLTFFFAVGSATPGMRYAGIQLSTFSGSRPTRAQRYKRLAGLLLSVAPLGLGLAWALFDDGHLTWHDRLSHTYLRKL